MLFLQVSLLGKSSAQPGSGSQQAAPRSKMSEPMKAMQVGQESEAAVKAEAEPRATLCDREMTGLLLQFRPCSAEAAVAAEPRSTL